MFSGNEIGMLLAHWLFEKNKNSGAKLAVIASTVSSKMTRALAQKVCVRICICVCVCVYVCLYVGYL